MTELLRSQNIFMAWRIRVAPWHPLPDGRSCLDYLVTEVGEAVDARLRMDRPDDDRANGKQRHLGRELAQVVDMAYATAIRYDIDLDDEIDEWLAVVLERGNLP
jgi:NTP pyrophosphatase (non-canonical NTP hydrolase)